MRTALLVVSVVVCACGGHSSQSVDAAAGDGAIADTSAGACELPATLPGVTTPAQQLALFFSGGGGGGGPSSYSIDNQLTNDPVYNVISLETYKLSVFAGGFPTAFPVTIPLTGDELDDARCGACVLGFGGVSNGSWTGTYFATGGTVVLTALSKTRITGKLVNITLTHVEYGAEHTKPLDDGCDTTVAELDFDAVPSMALTGPSDVAPRLIRLAR